MELSNAERRLVRALKDGEASPDGIEGLGHVEAMNAGSWLQSKGLVTIRDMVTVEYSIGGEGKRFLAEGLPESRLLEAVTGRITMDDLRERSGLAGKEFSIALGWLKRKGWIEITDGVVTLTDEGGSASAGDEPEIEVLRRLENGPIASTEFSEDEIGFLESLRKRGSAVVRDEKVGRLLQLTQAGSSLDPSALEEREEVSQLTPELLQGGEWRNVSLRKYDINALAPGIYGGRVHPLTAITETVRRIFLGMGFSEIEGPYIESAFWCMDVLFIPQDHPARDLQDTMYLDRPEPPQIEPEVMEIISKVHLDGGETGSKGWGYEWSEEEGMRALLRTHTTVNTIRHLYNNRDPPVRVFSIDKVFRREAIDTTHLPEFFQIEGIVMEKGASFSKLVGILSEFYRMMGFDDVRIRPAYFPYTEPSLEVEVFFGGHWMELGGAGIFRPEVTEPLGIEHPVLAWGLGLERLAMMAYGIEDIRKLYMSDIDQLKKRPLLSLN